MLTLYVDDILIAGKNKEIINVVASIKNKYKVSTDKRAIKIIGMNIIKINKSYEFNQKKKKKKKKKKKNQRI